jgi:hypothetical protein
MSDFRASLREFVIFLLTMAAIVLLVSCTGVKAEQATLRVRTHGPHHRAVLPGVTLNCGKGWRAHLEAGYSGPVFWPGEERYSTRAPGHAFQGEVFLTKELR